MSIEKKYFDNAAEAILFLENLALNTNQTIVFRGHNNEDYRLVNTWQRFTSIPHESWNNEIDRKLTKFKIGLEKQGIASFDHKNRFEAMEFCRHYGGPTPCLDFTYSPYISLFFAFDGIRRVRDITKFSVIYALNIEQLAHERAVDLYDPRTNYDAYLKALRKFKSPGQDLFKEGFPPDTLNFIPFPSSFNKRMQRQLGCLLYDTLRYDRRNLSDLEDYIATKVEPEESDDESIVPGKPILIKVFINQKTVSDIFSRLELMNITGGYLYDSAEGVALDIKNSYNYNPTFSYLRDIEPPAVDDALV